MSGKLTRRTVLGGAAAGVAGALLSRMPVHAATPPAQIGARVGATLNLKPFPSGTTFAQAIDRWNARTGTTMRCFKIFYQDRDFGASNDLQINGMLDVGDIEALISVRPAWKDPAQMSADHTALMQLLSRLHDILGLPAQVCLFSEIGPKDMPPAAYKHVVNYYGPSIRQFYPLVYDVSGHLGPTTWQTYDPQQPNVDGYAADFYANAFFSRKKIRLEPLAELAGPLPLDIWEIGNASGVPFPITTKQVDKYFQYLQGFLTQRAASGLPVGNVAWFNGPVTGNYNELVGSSQCPTSPRDIADYQTFYAAVNGLVAVIGG